MRVCFANIIIAGSLILYNVGYICKYIISVIDNFAEKR